MQPLHGAAPGIENEFLRADFDQRARPKALQTWRRRAGAEKGNAKRIVDSVRHLIAP
jgi:hypothetical protein